MTDREAELARCVAELLALTKARTWLIAEREVIARAEATLGVSADQARNALLGETLRKVMDDAA